MITNIGNYSNEVKMKKVLFIFIVIFLYIESVAQFSEVNTVFTGVSEGDLAWADWDNDGDLDVIVMGIIRTGENSYDRSTKQYRNNGNGTFSNLSTNIPAFQDGGADFGDYDNDGDVDLLVTGGITNPGGDTYLKTTKIYKNNGSGVFTDINATIAGCDEGSVAWGDYDNDGDLDFVVFGRNASNTRLTKLYRNDGSDTFNEVSAGFMGVFSGSANWGDYDNDGDLDLLLTGRNSDERTNYNGITKIYKNNGDGTFTDTPYGLAQFSMGEAEWADFDYDGDLDIVIVGRDNATSTRLYIYRNDGGSFTKTFDYLNGVSSGSLTLGDYDNDGDMDIAFTGSGSGEKTRVLTNNGSYNFTAIDLLGLGVNYGLRYSTIEFADYDNDGDLDILTTGLPTVDGSGSYNFDREIYLFNNSTVTANVSPSVPDGLSSSVTDYSIALSWNKSTDTETPQNGLNYNIKVGTTSGGSNIFSSESRSNGTRMLPVIGNTNSNNSWIIQGLEGGLYYWTVQSIDGGQKGSAFATEGTFNIKPKIPVLSSPADNAYKVSTSPTLSWVAATGASTYSIQISTVEDFSSLITDESDLVSSSYSTTGLIAASRYYWRVSATNSAGTSDWSESFSFLVQLSPPVLIFPANNETDISSNATLQWDDVNSADSYSCRVSANSNLSFAIIDVTNLTSSEKQLSALAGNTTYYWAVKADNSPGNNSSDWTATRSFTTKSLTQISGALSGTLTKDNGPYEVSGDISIIDGTTLTIEAGVEIYFLDQYKIDVQGRLLAVGTETDSIKFLKAISASNGWKGIDFINTPNTNDSSIVSFSVFEYANYNTFYNSKFV